MVRGEEEARWSRGEEEVAGLAEEEKKQQAGSECFFWEEGCFFKFLLKGQNGPFVKIARCSSNIVGCTKHIPSA